MKRRFGIRFKLLLVSLSLLAIPWAGYRFIQEMEIFLRQAQARNLETTSRALASMARNSAALPPLPHPEQGLYAHPLSQPVVLDGYAEDWQPLLPLAQSVGGTGLRARLLLQATPRYHYLLLQVADHSPDYFSGPFIKYGGSDQVELFLVDGNGLGRSWLIAPRAPGDISAHRLNDGQPGPMDGRLTGAWEETSGGYNLELRIPAELSGGGLALRILNEPEGTRLDWGSPGDKSGIMALIQPSNRLQALLEDNLLPHSRLRVLDSQGWVLAGAGALEPDYPGGDSSVPWIIRKLLNLVLKHRSDDHQAIPARAIRLTLEPVASALSGTTASRRYQLPGSETLVLATAVPILTDGRTEGAVLVEQTTDNILSLQNQAMQRLLLITFILFVLVSVALLGFASLLTRRIRRLHRQMEEAVAADGRIIGQIRPPSTGDEIGDLGRGFASVLDRLQEYNRYLQAMASRLSHEFRTPLAIIRHSLENSAEVNEPEEKQAYLERALKGVDRLELILRQLQEATRLEKALEQVETRPFNLCELLEASLRNYKAIHPDLAFHLDDCTGLRANGAPELVYQALEKLMDNAVDFHRPGTPITLSVRESPELLWICVENLGPALPRDMDLFQSMISIRENSRKQPHLGLGLYLVRLIADFHRGDTRAENLPGGDGVRFCFSLRRMS